MSRTSTRKPHIQESASRNPQSAIQSAIPNPQSLYLDHNPSSAA